MTPEPDAPDTAEGPYGPSSSWPRQHGTGAPPSTQTDEPPPRETHVSHTATPSHSPIASPRTETHDTGPESPKGEDVDLYV